MARTTCSTTTTFGPSVTTNKSRRRKRLRTPNGVPIGVLNRFLRLLLLVVTDGPKVVVVEQVVRAIASSRHQSLLRLWLADSTRRSASYQAGEGTDMSD